MKTLTVALTILALSCVASATPVQYIGHRSTNDGSVFVGPYTLLVDGQLMLGTCLSRGIAVASGWQADVVAPADFDGPTEILYLQAEWLNLQFDLFPTQTVGIHHGIWNLFGSSYTDGAPWVALASANYGSVDPNSFRVLVPRQAGASQTFLIDNSAPEAGTLLLTGIGLLLLAKSKVRALLGRGRG